MKQLNRMLALLVALLMLSSCAFAEDTEQSLSSTNPVLAKVGDREITLNEADEIAYLLYYYGYVEEYPDYEAALDYLTETYVIEKHLVEAGYDQFTDDEMVAFQNDAAAEWEAMLEAYINNYLTEDTEEARATLREQAIAYYTNYGYSEASFLEDMMLTEAYARMEADMAAGYEPTEDEIQSVFQEYGAQYQQAYENDIASYEYNVNYYGYESWYTPAGYRGVLHILLEVDQELLNTWETAQLALDEAASAETVDEAAVTAAQTALDAAKQAVLDSKKTEIDDIYARLEKGEDFMTLINEYNTDPGMTYEDVLAEGYLVHQETAGLLYDADFVNGAFQEHMTAPGTYSTPVVSAFGIHVVYYLRDVESGLILTDDIRTEIVDYLNSMHMQNAYETGLAEWGKDIVITIDEEMVANVTAEVQAAIAAETAEETTETTEDAE